jgi:hypothetical protein
MQEVRLCERAAVENNCEGVVPSPILAKKPRSFYFYYFMGNNNSIICQGVMLSPRLRWLHSFIFEDTF